MSGGGGGRRRHSAAPLGRASDSCNATQTRCCDAKPIERATGGWGSWGKGPCPTKRRPPTTTSPRKATIWTTRGCWWRGAGARAPTTPVAQGATAPTHTAHLQVAGGLPPRSHSSGGIESDSLGLDGCQAREVGRAAAGEARCLPARRAGGQQTLLAEETALCGRRLRRSEGQLAAQSSEHCCVA